MKHNEKLALLIQPFILTPELVAWINETRTSDILRRHTRLVIQKFDPAGQSSDKNPQPQEA